MGILPDDTEPYRHLERQGHQMNERQELHCHVCNRYVQFNIDLSLNGNHVLNCPNCGHEHCRVVQNGRITDIRWDQRNGPSIMVSAITITSTTTSTWDTYNLAGAGAATTNGTSGNGFLYNSWLNTTSGS